MKVRKIHTESRSGGVHFIFQARVRDDMVDLGDLFRYRGGGGSDLEDTVSDAVDNGGYGGDKDRDQAEIGRAMSRRRDRIGRGHFSVWSFSLSGILIFRY